QRKFIVELELIGTFIVVVFATGSIVIDAKMHGVLGVPFIAFAPFVGIAIVFIFLERYQWHTLILLLQ
ncbi:MAG: hypothetical protein ACJ704_14055, partial [Nitrososphaeraceae archaeon]